MAAVRRRAWKRVVVLDGGALVILSGPTWVNNLDGTATVSVTFSNAIYCGVDFGTVAATYTQSAFSYIGDVPAAGLLLSTTHSFTVPEQHVGTETLADATYYFRIAGGVASFTYLAAEQTGVIDTVAPALTLPTTGTSTVSTVTGFGITTNESTGALYWVLVPNGDAPSQAQVKAGQQSSGAAAIDSGSQAISSSGAKTVADTVTGLTIDTFYRAVFMHEDGVGLQSSTNYATLLTASHTYMVPGIGFETPIGDVNTYMIPGRGFMQETL